MEEELNDEKLPPGVEVVWSTGSYHNRCIICQKCGRNDTPKKASAGTEIGILSLEQCCRC